MLPELTGIKLSQGLLRNVDEGIGHASQASRFLFGMSGKMGASFRNTYDGVRTEIDALIQVIRICERTLLSLSAFEVDRTTSRRTDHLLDVGTPVLDSLTVDSVHLKHVRQLVVVRGEQSAASSGTKDMQQSGICDG